jgi:hypothetical protein
MRRIGKRGMEDKIYFLMFEIIAFAMVAIIIIFAVRGLVNNSDYWKKYYSIDLGLMADLESINQGDFSMNYVLKLPNNNKYLDMYFLKDRTYDFVLEEDRIEVYDHPKEESKRATTYPYAPFKNADIMVNTVNANFLVLTKQKSVLALDKETVDTTEICPAYNTAKNIDDLKFGAIGLDNTAAPFAGSIEAVLKSYSSTSNINESMIIVSYEKSSPMTIYYDDDGVKKLWSQKLACMLGKEYADKYPDNTYEIKAYDGSLDNNMAFIKYMDDPLRNPDEYWIIIQISDDEVAITNNIFAQVIKDTMVKFYN